VYEALGRYDDAVTDYRAVLKAQPNDPSGWNNLGNCRMAQVDLCSSRSAGNRQSELHLPLLKSLLLVLCTQGPFPWQSVLPLRRVVQGMHPGLLCDEASHEQVLRAQGAWQDAADFYGKAYKLAPGFSFAAANQSLALYQLGKTNEATRTMKYAFPTPKWCRYLDFLGGY